jgi:hypothetical protein
MPELPTPPGEACDQHQHQHRACGGDRPGARDPDERRQQLVAPVDRRGKRLKRIHGCGSNTGVSAASTPRGRARFGKSCATRANVASPRDHSRQPHGAVIGLLSSRSACAMTVRPDLISRVMSSFRPASRRRLANRLAVDAHRSLVSRFTGIEGLNLTDSGVTRLLMPPGFPGNPTTSLSRL